MVAWEARQSHPRQIEGCSLLSCTLEEGTQHPGDGDGDILGLAFILFL